MTRLKRALMEQGRTNKWLSQQTNIDMVTLSLVANGKRNISVKYALRIAHVLGKTVEELFGYMIEDWLLTR